MSTEKIKVLFGHWVFYFIFYMDQFQFLSCYLATGVVCVATIVHPSATLIFEVPS